MCIQCRVCELEQTVMTKNIDISCHVMFCVCVCVCVCMCTRAIKQCTPKKTQNNNITVNSKFSHDDNMSDFLIKRKRNFNHT